MRDGSMPAATRASSKEMRSSVDIEFASLVVPNGASPQFCDNNHWQCLMNRSLSGERSTLNGVTAGASQPRMHWLEARVPLEALSDISSFPFLPPHLLSANSPRI